MIGMTARVEFTNQYGGMTIIDLVPPRRERSFRVTDVRAKKEFKTFIDVLQRAITDSFGLYAGYKTTPGMLDNVTFKIAEILELQERIEGFFFHAIKPKCTMVDFRQGDMSIHLRVTAPHWMRELVEKSDRAESSTVPG